MKRFSRVMFGIWSAVIGGVIVFAAVQMKSQGRETNAPPEIKVQDTPIEREAHGVTSYASIVKQVAPSVVNIYSTRTVREQGNPFFNDPFFRHFFGPDDNNNNNNNDDEDQDQGDRSRRHQHSMRSQSLGSGVIISPDGYILTANHVVAGADEIKVAMANGGQEYKAKVIGTDAPTDVAVLKIPGKDLPVVTIADSDKLEVGDVVLALGNPFGVGQTVTMGIVSGLGRTSLDINRGGYEDFIQTDAAINPGNSGGALVDAEGRLVGINTAIFSESGGYQGVGFAVPVNLARSVMEQLVKSGKVTRGYLGVEIQPLTPDLAAEFKLSDESGALVSDVRPNSPAAKAGLEDGDVIREVDGKKVADSAQLRLRISETAPGTKVTLKYLRSENEGKPVERTVTAVLGTLPGESNARGENAPSEESGSNYDSLDGVEVTDIDSEARQQYGIPSNVRGAVVTSVDENSNAADAGLQQGDVIQEINRQPVRTAEDAVKLSDKAHGSRVLLRIWRQTAGQGGSFYITVDNTKKK